MNSIRIPKISFKKMLWALGEHAFLLVLVLLCVGALISAFLFYAYVLPAQTKVPNVSESALKFHKDIFQQVVKEWNAQEQNLRDANTLAPRNIFRYNSSASP